MPKIKIEAELTLDGKTVDVSSEQDIELTAEGISGFFAEVFQQPVEILVQARKLAEKSKEVQATEQSFENEILEHLEAIAELIGKKELDEQTR